MRAKRSGLGRIAARLHALERLLTVKLADGGAFALVDGHLRRRPSPFAMRMVADRVPEHAEVLGYVKATLAELAGYAAL